jgi:hypothetical protein
LISKALVFLGSAGGNVVAAIGIGRIIRAKDYTTFIDRSSGEYTSACTSIWVSGVHAVVQRNSYLGFHADRRNSANLDPICNRA